MAGQGRARQDVALGYGESKEILILGCFVCQEAHILYFVAPSVNWDGVLVFSGVMDGIEESTHARMHCLYDMIGHYKIRRCSIARHGLMRTLTLTNY